MPAYSSLLEVDAGYSMITSGSFSSQTYRPGFDISFPVVSPLATHLKRVAERHERPWLVISSQPNIHMEFRDVVEELATEHPSFLVLDSCSANALDIKSRCREEETFLYPDVLQVNMFARIA